MTRVALVTGAARGIGAAVALRLAQDGHDVAVLDLNAAACADTIRAVEGVGRRGLAVGGNVSNEAASAAAVDQVAATLGPPTILINNAGVLRDRTLANMTLAEWDTVLDVNLKGAFLMSRAVQRHMRSSGWGRIVNLSSIAALGLPGQVNYSAAKAGVQGLTKALAAELGRFGVTVNAVAPGFVDTVMTREIAGRAGMTQEDVIAWAMRDIVVGRTGTPEDIAHAISFFVDERSGFTTGQVLYVAGAPRG